MGEVMKTETFSKPVILGFLGLILTVHILSAQASTGEIVCSTAFGEKSFTIHEESISFHKKDHLGASRSISSIPREAVRTHKKHLGFTKTLYVDGNKYQISIQNSKEFSEVEDYLSITGPKGHEMTYPLNCHSA